MTNWVDKSCASTIWLTPELVLERVRTYFGGPIELDPATEPNNPTKALSFFTEADNGLLQPWNAKKIFINPPFGGAIVDFLAKIHQEVLGDPTKEIVALLPCGARFSTKYFQKDALVGNLCSICFIKGRVKFIRPDGTVGKKNAYDSQIYGYNVDRAKFSSVFCALGKCLEVKTYD